MKLKIINPEKIKMIGIKTKHISAIIFLFVLFATTITTVLIIAYFLITSNATHKNLTKKNNLYNLKHIINVSFVSK